MRKLKEKGVCKGIAECKLVDTVKITQDMVYTVQGAFGIDGRAVMFQTSSGQMNITRCGEDILRTVFLSENNVLHPVCNLVMKSILDIRKQLGDGVKTYIALLNLVLKKCLNACDSILIAKQLYTFRTEFTSYFLSYEKHNRYDQNNMRKVVNNFFSTRFTKSVSKILSDVVSEWIYRQISLSFTEVHDFNKLIDNFHTLCIHFLCSPTVKSTVRNGCLINGKILGKTNIQGKKIFLKVFLYPEETTVEEGDIDCSVRIFVDETIADSNILLITNIILPGQTIFYLISKNILILQGIDFQQTKFIFEYVISNELTVEFKVENNFVWLGLDKVWQLLLCAPNSDMLRQYEESIVDCLRLLNFISDKYWFICSPGGCFEQKFAFHLYNACSKRNVPLFCNRSDLTVWHKMLDESKADNSNDCLECSRSVDDFIRSILKNFVNVTLDERVVNIICSSMWEISRLVHGTSDVDKGEPVVLKVEILMRSVEMAIHLLKLSGVVIAKSNRLL